MRITKDEYILKSFSKLRNKKWELYVITRIIHLLNDPEIEFVCQQPIKSRDGNRYLADLFFPGLKLFFEIDEEHHANEENIIADRFRESEIIDTTSFDVQRIRVYDENINDRDLKDIDNEIDNFIDFIKQSKEEFLSEGKFELWNYERKFDPNFYIEKGYIDIKENVRFQYHKDALRLFGYSGDHHQSATWKIPGTKKKVWFPKLYENKEWINTLSDDGETITMRKKDKSKIKKKEKFPIVFAHYKDSLSQVYYKFLGEFKLSLEDLNDFEHIFLRTKTKIDLKNL
jgi:very-short-patch-repair endonuclease